MEGECSTCKEWKRLIFAGMCATCGSDLLEAQKLSNLDWDEIERLEAVVAQGGLKGLLAEWLLKHRKNEFYRLDTDDLDRRSMEALK